MKMFVLTAEAAYEGGEPVLVVPARNRCSALQKIGATEELSGLLGIPGPTVVIPEEAKMKMGLPSTDGYRLFEVPLSE